MTKNITNVLTELGEEISELKTKSTQLNTQLESVEEQLNDLGIKNPVESSKVIKKLMKEIDDLNCSITDSINDIENILEDRT